MAIHNSAGDNIKDMRLVENISIAPNSFYQMEYAEVTLPDVAGDYNVVAKIENPNWQHLKEIKFSIIDNPASTTAENTNKPIQTAIISNNIYDDCKSATVNHIQSFLNRKGGSLQNSNLKDSYQLDINDYSIKNTPNSEYSPKYPLIKEELFSGKTKAMSPAELIYYSALENNINPVLLLAKIQQESNLISKSEETLKNAGINYQSRLNRATGYGIPNSNPDGNPTYRGFFAQLVGTTFQFSTYKNRDNKTFGEAYNSYTVDQTGEGGQAGSFQRFMTVYNAYVEEMNDVSGGVCNITDTSSIVTQKPIVNNEPTGETYSTNIQNTPVNLKNNGYYKPINPFEQWGELWHECTRYAFGRTYEKTGEQLTFSQGYGRHGGKWYDLVESIKNETGKLNRGLEPRSNSLVIWSGGKYGHVAFVESVVGDKITITEANWSGKGKYNGHREFTKDTIKKRGSLNLVGYIYLSTETDTLPPPPIAITQQDKNTANLSLTLDDSANLPSNAKVQLKTNNNLYPLQFTNGQLDLNIDDLLGIDTKSLISPLNLAIQAENGSTLLDGCYPFMDVCPKAWYSIPIMKLWREEFVNGYGDTTLYKPNNTASRAEFVSVAIKTTVNEDVPPVNSSFFGDVNGDEWYAKYIQYAKNQKIVSGCDTEQGLFCPDDAITRAEAITVLLKTFDIAVDNRCRETGFSDVEKDKWYTPYICTAKKKNLISGYQDGSFKPNTSLSRAEMAAIICRAKFGTIECSIKGDISLEDALASENAPSETEVEADINTNTENDNDTGTETDINPDTGTDTGTEPDTNPDTETEPDTDIEPETNPDTGTTPVIIGESTIQSAGNATENVTRNDTLITTCTFQDVDQTQFYADEVDAFCSAGIIIGYSIDGERVFKPARDANFAETISVLLYARDYATVASRPKNIDPWYGYYMDKVQDYGVTANNSMAGNTVTRGEIMDYIVKIFYPNETVTDSSSFLKAKGITNGEGREYNVNRSEMVVMAYGAAEETGTIDNIQFGLVDTPPPIPVTNTLGESILERATPEIGRKTSILEGGKYIWADNYTYCARFVRVMYSKLAKWGTAKAMCNAYETSGLMNTAGEPPAGAPICYEPDSSNGNYGHIAISAGDGTEIGVTNTSNGVTERTIRETGYQGWIDPQDYTDNYANAGE